VNLTLNLIQSCRSVLFTVCPYESYEESMRGILGSTCPLRSRQCSLPINSSVIRISKRTSRAIGPERHSQLGKGGSTCPPLSRECFRPARTGRSGIAKSGNLSYARTGRRHLHPMQHFLSSLADFERIYFRPGHCSSCSLQSSDGFGCSSVSSSTSIDKVLREAKDVHI
jgi:hypothetical protein